MGNKLNENVFGRLTHEELGVMALALLFKEWLGLETITDEAVIASIFLINTNICGEIGNFTSRYDFYRKTLGIENVDDFKIKKEVGEKIYQEGIWGIKDKFFKNISERLIDVFNTMDRDREEAERFKFADVEKGRIKSSLIIEYMILSDRNAFRKFLKEEDIDELAFLCAYKCDIWQNTEKKFNPSRGYYDRSSYRK